VEGFERYEACKLLVRAARNEECEALKMTVSDEELHVRTHGRPFYCKACGYKVIALEDEARGSLCPQCNKGKLVVEGEEKPAKPKKTTDTRMDKAKKMYNSGMRAYPAAENMWYVKGSKGDVYSVARKGSEDFSCTCTDFTIRGIDCKHILLTKLCLPIEELDGVIIPPKDETPEVRAEFAANEAMSFLELRRRKKLTRGLEW
jgi:predicted Zn-ribbon and HTH transcriptional regulator